MDIKTTCPYCGVGCEMIISRNNSQMSLSGDKDSPVNQGMLCIKGQTLLETVGTDANRILQPIVNKNIVSWHKAIEKIAQLFTNTKKDEIGLYLSGQMLIEDLYVAKKMAQKFGIKNLESNSRLCMYSTVAANKRAYGADIVPVSYADIYHAEVIIIIGSNTANCHPVVFSHIKKSSAFVVCIDVRKTNTSELSDLFIKVENGRDMELIADLPERDWFKGKKVLSVYSQGLTQTTDATDKVNSLINMHIQTGNINKKGCGVLSLTGQPNAMGGRELGISSTDLTASEFFSTPQIKTLWVMATNPAHSMINYRKIDNLIVSDFTKTLTTEQADIVLPAGSWSEKSGHCKNSERRYLMQNAFLPFAGNAKADWEIICLVAKALGLSDFDYKSSNEIWEEIAIDTSWQPQIKVREQLVEINSPARDYQPVINNGRLLTQWHGMSRTGRSKTLNKLTKKEANIESIHHISNDNLFKGRTVELDKYSKQPCFKSVKR
ncbi:MAG: molybdopterin-dependent oxidoreductase [Candidatus Thioglobus sp.]|nr:MAG: molybdopterin-dependent oxidoreductase [Candidatus Thioglobus sp.]KAA0448639.1 MAG: molybdopterin-dependent oxidoreductase [Candidatus Thioglobus sp.]